MNPDNLDDNIFWTAYDNELIPVDVGGGDISIVSNEEDLLAVAQASGFLPRLQLFGGSSDAVKEGKSGVGRWGLVSGKDQLEDMGPEVDTLVIAGRVKALDVSGEQVVTSYDMKTDTFKDIAARSETANSRCMFGPEFLVYVPKVKAFATVFLSSATARREARSLHARLRKAATFKGQLITGKKHKWHGPIFTPCTTPFDMPTNEAILDEAKKFLNPKQDGPTLAPAADAGAGDGRAR